MNIISTVTKTLIFPLLAPQTRLVRLAVAGIAGGSAAAGLLVRLI